MALYAFHPLSGQEASAIREHDLPLPHQHNINTLTEQSIGVNVNEKKVEEQYRSTTKLLLMPFLCLFAPNEIHYATKETQYAPSENQYAPNATQFNMHQRKYNLY